MRQLQCSESLCSEVFSSAVGHSRASQQPVGTQQHLAKVMISTMMIDPLGAALPPVFEPEAKGLELGEHRGHPPPTQIRALAFDRRWH